MSFGGQSNAPWQRNVMQGHPQANTFHQGTQQMFMQNAQQNNMAAFGHGGGMQGGGGNMYPSGGGPSVSYPQPRSGLNPVAFQQGAGQSQSHYNSIGTVTKINNDCGLVNDEVFFYRNVCKGPEPKLGDRVIFEATYSNNGQFKWNATRIQLMQQHQQPQPLMGSSKSNYSSVAPPNEYQRSQMRHSSPKRSPVRAGISRHDRDRRDRERDRSRRSRDRDDDEQDRKRRREDRSRDRVNSTNRSTEGRSGTAAAVSSRSERDRERGESRKKERDITARDREEREKARERSREKESHRKASKAGRRARTIRRYMVQIPKSLLPHVNYSRNGQHKSGDYNYLQRIAIDYMSSNEGLLSTIRGNYNFNQTLYPDSENNQIDDNVVKGDVRDGFITDSENDQINHNVVACRRRKRANFSASKTQTENKKRK